MELDALIAEVGAEAIERFRRPSMDRAAAERTLRGLRALVETRGWSPGQALPPDLSLNSLTRAGSRRPEPNPPTPARAEQIAAPIVAESARRAVVAGEPAPTPSVGEGGGRAKSLRAAAQRVTGGHRAIPNARAPRERDTLDHEVDPFLDQDRQLSRQARQAAPRSALLRPPSRPLPRVTPPTPPPEPPTATRAAMGALFDDDSNDGLMLFGDGDDAPDGFAPQAGTDPGIAPLPDLEPDGARDEPPAERTMDEIAGPLVPRSDLAVLAEEPLLAGAEEPMPMDVPAAPFGFGPGDAEPTRVDPGPSDASLDRHAPGHLSEAVVVSSVRKLFRR